MNILFKILKKLKNKIIQENKIHNRRNQELTNEKRKPHFTFKANEMYFTKNISDSLKPYLEHPVSKKSIRNPKRFENPIEMLKYFIKHTSLHGIKYSLDSQLYIFERAIWIIFVIFGFICTITVSVWMNQKFKNNQTSIVIDDINYDIFRVPFPSVTLCPGSRIDWNKVIKMSNNLIPKNNKDVKDGFLDLLGNFSTLRLSNLYKLRFNKSDAVMKSLNQINVTDVLIKVMPDCEKFIFNCSWSYSKKNCCDLFEVQKTTYGFCYSFNSLTSVSSKMRNPYNTHTFGFRSGLKLTLSREHLTLPPSEKDNKVAVYMISHTKTYPSKARYITYGRRYNIDIKFTSGYASPQVLSLENSEKPPCKFDNGEYKFENCLATCHGKYIQNKCGCNPSFFFPFVDNVRECNVTDLACVSNLYEEIEEVQYALLTDEPNPIKKFCQCPKECEYCSYDDFVIDLPNYESDQVVLDVHFNGPTGVRYKRDMLTPFLDRFVMMSGVFGLFMGGSMLTMIEFFYCLITGSIVYVYKRFFSKRTKKTITKNQHLVPILSCNDLKVYPLLDFPAVSNKNISRF